MAAAPSGTRVCTATTPCPSGASGAMAAWLCLFGWETAAAGLRQRCSPSSPGTYEIGYMFAALAFVVWCLRARSVKAGLFSTAPRWAAWAWRSYSICCAVAAAAPATRSHWISPGAARAGAADGCVSPGLNSRILQEDCGTLQRRPAVAAGAGRAGRTAAFLRRRAKTEPQNVGCRRRVWPGGLALPALLLALSARYQAPGAITWKWGYIPAAASSIGFALVVAVLLAALAGACRKLPQILSILARLA